MCMGVHFRRRRTYPRKRARRAFRRISTNCLVNLDKLAHQVNLAPPVAFLTPHMPDHSTLDPRSALIICDQCASSIFTEHSDSTTTETPRFPLFRRPDILPPGHALLDRRDCADHTGSVGQQAASFPWRTNAHSRLDCTGHPRVLNPTNLSFIMS